MRIIAGSEKGRKIIAPEGEYTRPTIDRVRESIMSSVNSACAGFEDLVVADLFAGSGALGFECLSRGAHHALLIDNNTSALAAIKENAKTLAYGEDKVSIKKMDVTKERIPYAQPFDLVFCDPPYIMEPSELFSVLARAKEQGALADSCLVVYENNHQIDDALIESFGMQRKSHKKYGKTFVDFLFFL